ncbi:MAG: response regulator [Alphaproteobacteria bacterium]|nr:response regulator [Alphaproteobacteria bacterium]MBU1515605.1 response regulator [Alphaproteobacteria bacterium]MBU2096940.1 response regulator [Alphaproteobacteria bacterium]MBU2149595.1 response regulator [Alphaproteobacteria bacterium]MBU2305669.1 response regulator [Alphaproteobacteria bacterium]
MGVLNRAEARAGGLLGGGLEARVVAIALMSTIAALLAAFSVYQYSNWANDRAELAAKSVRLAQAIGVLAHRGLVVGDAEASITASRLLESSETAVAAAYSDLSGHHVRFGNVGGLGSRLGFKGVKAIETRFWTSGLEVRAPHYVAGRQVGEVVLWVDDRQVLMERLSNISIALLLSLLATLGAGLVARRLARRALAPLRALDEAMETVAASRDFSARLPIARDDEVGRLTLSFNRLLGGLQDYDTDLRGAVQEASEACDDAERANRMKSQFLANMGHELRTPLNGVLGMTQALLRDDLSAGQRERVEVILNSGTALLTVLNDVLDLADMDAGTVSIETAPFDLEAVIRQACETAVTLAESKGLALAVEIDASAAGSWIGDATRLRQVLYNLVSNAMKFTASGGVHVRAEDAEGLVISVTDSGIGIAPEALPKLFETFTQGEGGSTRRFGGAGLGLAICRRLAGLMGGTLEAQSEVGEGSVFTIWLPLERGAPAAEAPAAELHVAALRVLVAEDNETNQRVVRTVLNALGVDPTVVPDGRAAVEAWGRGEWDLVLMDIQMPIRDGVAATRDIRRIEAERGLTPTRIVALTANAMPAQVSEYEAAGMDGVVSKPIMIDQLHAALRDACGAKAA